MAQSDSLLILADDGNSYTLEEADEFEKHGVQHRIAVSENAGLEPLTIPREPRLTRASQVRRAAE